MKMRSRLQVLAGYVGWIDPGGIWDSLVALERLHTYLFLPISKIHQPRMLRERSDESQVRTGVRTLAKTRWVKINKAALTI